MLLTERHGTARNGTERHGTAERVFLRLSDWLNDEGLFIFYMLVLNLTASRITYSSLKMGGGVFLSEMLIFSCDFSLTFMCAIIIDLLICIFTKKQSTSRKIIKAIFIFISLCMFAADLFTLYTYMMPVNKIMFDFLLLTNFRETTEFLQVYILNPRLWIFFLVIAAALFILRRVFLYVLNFKKLMLVLFLCAFCAGVFCSWREMFYYGRGCGRIMSANASTRIYFTLSGIYNDRQEYKKMMSEVPEKVELTENNSSIPYFVFVLGESTSRNHMQIYGYELPTTPNLSARQKNGELYAFSDTVSPEAGTAQSMKKIFTFYRYGEKANWFSYMNIFRIFREAGFYTAWISNQESGSLSGTGINNFYASRCDERKFTEAFKDSGYRGNFLDDAVLPLIDDVVKESKAKNFYVVHLMGTHFHYHKRYSSEFAKFSPKTTTTKDITRARYDNAILYNDFIVNEIIKRFEDKNAILFYISDHGEDVFDTVDYFLGHAEVKSRFMIEIPFIVWTSKKFRAEYPEISKRIAESVNRPYMTDDIIHTVLDVAGIKTPDYDDTKSVINPNFDAGRKRIFLRWIYDKEGGLNDLP